MKTNQGIGRVGIQDWLLTCDEQDNCAPDTKRLDAPCLSAFDDFCILSSGNSSRLAET